MAISEELFLAILSMDSYTRGDGAGITLTANSIGNAVIVPVNDADVRKGDWGTYGFAATAYRMSGSGVDGIASGELLISYRGTDDLPDLLYGWTLGAGYAPAAQGELAIRFYEAVSGLSVYAAGGVKPIVTGHSLGGGLAGYVAMLSGSEAIGYDHMPFGAAAWIKFTSNVYSVLLQSMINGQASLTDAGAATLEIVMTLLRPQLEGLVAKGLVSLVDGVITTGTALDALKGGLIDLMDPMIQAVAGGVVDALRPVLDAVTPEIIESWDLHVPDFGDFKGIATQAEILQFLRDGTIPTLLGQAIQGLLGTLAPFTRCTSPFATSPSSWGRSRVITISSVAAPASVSDACPLIIDCSSTL